MVSLYLGKLGCCIPGSLFRLLGNLVLRLMVAGCHTLSVFPWLRLRRSRNSFQSNPSCPSCHQLFDMIWLYTLLGFGGVHIILLKTLSYIMVALWTFLPAGQASVLHSWLSDPSPWHSWPPFDGAGSLQDLVLVWVPPPQATGQVSQPPQAPQLPSTLWNDVTV